MASGPRISLSRAVTRQLAARTLFARVGVGVHKFGEDHLTKRNFQACDLVKVQSQFSTSDSVEK